MATQAERSQRWRDAHREESREYMRLYMRERRKDPAIRAASAKYHRDRYAANAEHYRERVLRWARENPDKACAIVRRRRARLAEAPGQFTPEEFTDLCNALGNVCFYCGTAAKLTADHNVPLSRGGANDITNILPSCRPCNSSKGSLTADEYMQRKESTWRR